MLLPHSKSTRYATVKENSVVELSDRVEAADALTAMLRAGAQALIRQAVDAELQALLSSHAGRVTDEGRAAVVRNGYLPERQVQTGIGPVTVKIPKVRANTGEAVTFRSALVPPYVRKTRTLEAVLPWLYLKGVSSGEMGEALRVLVGPEAEVILPAGSGHLVKRLVVPQTLLG